MRKNIIAVVLFLFAFMAFLLSPVRHAPDAKYSVLLSQTLFDLQTFSLNSYSIRLRRHPVERKRLGPNTPSNLANGYPNQELIHGKLFHYFPPGSSILSVPLVKVLNVLGFSADDERGKFNEREEVIMQAIIAAFLMALAVSLFYKMAGVYLSDTKSVIVAIAAGFGTQVWSTASRGLWSNTWGLLIVTFIIYRLLLEIEGKRRFNVAILASLTSWLYFIRPTFAVVIISISIYVFLKNRRNFIPYCAIGILWLGLFVGYSWYNFQQILPNYYLERTFSIANIPDALPANLFSPSRGLLIYVPISGYILLLTIARFSRMQPRSLTILALAVIVAHLIIISLPRTWWGGNCYGSRLTTDLVPWFVLLSILVIRLGTNALQRGVLYILLCLSIFINGRGALDFETWKWNMCPEPVSFHPERLWDWKHPQFLAGISYSIEGCTYEE